MPITYGDAQSRFTRTPIRYEAAREPGAYDASGRHQRPGLLRRQRIDVFFDPGADSPERVRQVQRHEDIHAATYGDPVPASAFRDGGYALGPYNAFEKALRAGAPDTELPAYMGAGELDVTPEERARFMDEYKRTLAPDKRALLDRMDRAGSLAAPEARPMLAPAVRRDLMLRPGGPR